MSERGWLEGLRLEDEWEFSGVDFDAAEAITYKLRYIKDGDEWDDKIYGITKKAVLAALGIPEDTE